MIMNEEYVSLQSRW